MTPQEQVTPGERLKELRTGQGLTQEQLSKKTRPRVRREIITKIERGQAGIGPDVGRRLARALAANDGLSADEVYRQLVAPPPLSWQQRVEQLEADLRELRERLEDEGR